MAYIVTDNCINCKYTDCVEVCPVDCFHEGPNFLVIDPVACIDCSLCEPECPANAIYKEEMVPSSYATFISLNKKLAEKWPVITRKKSPLSEAAQWDGRVDKLVFLEEVGTFQGEGSHAVST